MLTNSNTQPRYGTPRLYARDPNNIWNDVEAYTQAQNENQLYYGSSDEPQFDRSLAYWDPMATTDRVDSEFASDLVQRGTGTEPTNTNYQENLQAPSSRMDQILDYAGRATPHVLDAAQLISQKAYIDKIAKAKKNQKPYFHRLLELDVRPVQGLPQEAMDAQEAAISRMRNPAKTSDAALNLAGNLSTAFKRDDFRNQLHSKNAEVILQDRQRFLNETNANIARLFETGQANAKERYNVYQNNRQADLWKLGQERKLWQQVTDQLADDSVLRAKYNLQRDLNVKDRQYQELNNQRDQILAQLTRLNLSSAERMTLEEELKELNKALKNMSSQELASMGDAYGSIYTGDVQLAPRTT